MNASMFDWTQRLVDAALEGTEISEWERGFLNDQKERLEKYGADTRYSSKQLDILIRVQEKIDFESMPDED